MVSVPIDISGPVQGEVFIVALKRDRLVLTGPDGPRPWLIELQGGDNPLDEVRRVIVPLLPGLRLLHSTSWRWQGMAVTLTFIGVVDHDPSMKDKEVVPVPTARGKATAAPTAIHEDQVLHHSLRHLAWLARGDDIVRDVLDAEWHAALAGYVPATFEQIG